MPDTTTPNFNFVQPEPGASEDTWGAKLNSNWAAADTAIFDRALKTITVGAGDGLTGGGNLSANRTLALTGQALALHNLATSGHIVRTGAATYVTRTLTAGTGLTVTNGDGIGGNPTPALTGQALALHNLSTNGVIVRTGSGTVAGRTITASTGISATNGDGVSGNPALALTGQAAALHNLSTNGLVARTGADTVVGRTITAANGVAVTNGDGVAGAPAFALTGQALAVHNLASSGIIVRTGAGTVTNRSVAAGDGIGLVNGDGIAGNPTVAVDATVVRTNNAQTITAGHTFSGAPNFSGAPRFNSATNKSTIRSDLGLGDVATMPILGTVSQSAGVPTGSVIERGTNANGEYVRFADGTQICTSEVASVDTNVAAGAIFSSALITKTTPAAFIVAAAGSGSTKNTVFAWVNGRCGNATSWSATSWAAASRTGDTIMLIAIGRWF